MVLSDKLVNYCSFMFMLISVSKYVSVFILLKILEVIFNLILKTLIIDTNESYLNISNVCKLVGKMLETFYPQSSPIHSHLSSK